MNKNNKLKMDLQMFAAGTTKAIDLVNPEVMADAISAELESKIRFAPYARIDTTLEATAGDTITRPRYAYIGPAEDLTEGVPMDTTKLSMTTTKVTVKEAGKAVEVTETAVLTNVDGTLSEAENQLGLSMADKMEIDYLASMATTELTLAKAPTVAENIIDAIALFNDEEVGKYILFISSKDYTELSKSFIKGNTFLKMDEIAELLGLAAIERTNRLPNGTAYVQKQGAVEIVYKKRPEIDKDKDILGRSIVIAGNTFYTTNLYNEGGVVKIATV